MDTEFSYGGADGPGRQATADKIAAEGESTIVDVPTLAFGI